MVTGITEGGQMVDDAVAALDLRTLVRFCEVALVALGDAREEIDALNVYPVPDGDTGTNLFLTFEAAHAAMLEQLDLPADEAAAQEAAGPAGEEAAAPPETAVGGPGTLEAALTAFSRGALLGARGNSGVILSQIIGALCKRLGERRPGETAASALAEGLVLAADASYAAVGQPAEGTILSVARAAADAAAAAAARAPHRLGLVVRAASRAAHEALQRTPEQLPVLKAAGVVDAGGRGLCVLLDAAERTISGRRAVGRPAGLGNRAIPVPLPSGDLTAEGPAYEVMYLLEADDDRVPELRRRLAGLGDSLVVVGGDRLWNVHVHVEDVGPAVEAGIEAGRPYRIRVTHFAEQGLRRAADTAPAAGGGRRGRKVVVLAAGAGLVDVFTRAGAAVVPAGPGRRPSTGQLLEAVEAAGAAEVILLPNDRDSVALAEAAARTAREAGVVRVAVIPTHEQVQGLAALAVHEPGRAFDEDVLHMTAAARHARSGAVTVSSRRAMTTAGPCEPGDVLGAIEGDFVVVGGDLFTVATEVLERLLGGGGELVTVVAGAAAGDLGDRCAAYLAERHPTVDVVTYDGGQERYPLLLGVE